MIGKLLLGAATSGVVATTMGVMLWKPSRSTLAKVVTCLCVLQIAPISLAQPLTVHAAAPVDVTGWAPYWQASTALSAFTAHSGSFGELSPFFYTVTGANTIATTGTSAATIQSFKNAAGGKLIATVFDGTPAGAMAAILADPTTRALHVQTIANFVISEGYAGIDLDYEQFAFADGRSSWPATRPNWVQFLTDLAGVLHANAKSLVVSVPPVYNGGQAANSGYWVYDFAAMGTIVDRIRIMTYSYSTASAGPIAPINWVSSSLNAALALVPASKIVLGIPAYGTDWVTNIAGSCPVGAAISKRSITTKNAASFAYGKGAVPAFDPITKERTFTYVDSFGGNDAQGFAVRCNVTRTVWYADADAIYHRVVLAQQKGIAGVALWALGNEDALSWQGIEAARAGQPFEAPALAVPPPAPAPPPPILGPPALPARYADTRPGYATIDGQGAGTGQRSAGSVLEVQIAGRGSVLGSATSVSLNVTALGIGSGFVTVYACGTQPGTSNLNVRAGQIISNTVITRLSPTGTVCLYTQAAANLIVDVFNVLPPTTFAPLPTPSRLADTRAASPTVDGLSSGTGRLEIGSILEVAVAGRGGVPADATSAVLNVTVDGATNGGYLTVWPCDAPQPSTSNVNFVFGSTLPNAVVTALSVSGTVCVYASAPTHVIVDAFGSLADDSFAKMASPARLADSRTFHATFDGQSAGSGIRAAGSVLELQVGSRAGLSATPQVVVLNLTVDGPAADGYVTAYPCGTARPNVSSVNYFRGQTLPNLVLTKLSVDGKICIFVSSTTHLIVDAFGSLTLS